MKYGIKECKVKTSEPASSKVIGRRKLAAPPKPTGPKLFEKSAIKH
jgi:hypothetical protein